MKLQQQQLKAHYGMIPTVDEVDIMVHNGSEFVGYLYDGTSGQSATASLTYDADAK